MAIYLGFFNHHHHFYSIKGKLIQSMGFAFPFAVSNFAHLSELKPILAKVPNDISPRDLDHLLFTGAGPMREDGEALLQRMTQFKVKAETIYQNLLSALEGPKTRLAHPDKPNYLSLTQIASALLPSSLERDGAFSAPALYAVHTAVNRTEGVLRHIHPSVDCRRPDNLYEVFPLNYTATLDKVAAIVRQYTEALAACHRTLVPRYAASAQAMATFSRTSASKLPRELANIPIVKFIDEARSAVLESRTQRQWTSHGILEASSGAKLCKPKWSQASKDILLYLEWWASYDLFAPGSRFHAYGALLLRALDLYQDAHLDQSTAWTFLQEIGVIAPWEIPSRYKTRLPGVAITRGGGLSRETPDHFEASRRVDVAADIRSQVVGGETVFCIDDPLTVVVDDGVSLERTSEPDEFWVHVHVADPASVIKPDSELARLAELIPENIYLPGHFQAMLPSEPGDEDAGLVKQFSLRSRGPAITFSAKLNGAGDVLDYDIKPGTQRDVLYLDPADVSSFCDEPPPPPPAKDDASLVVGTLRDRAPHVPERPMVAAEDLTQNAKDDLLTLYRLAEASKRKRLSEGAMPYFAPKPSVSVVFDSAVERTPSASVFPADPYIEVGRESSVGCSVVSNFMVLAGQLAARWCASRGIPVPYRRDARSTPNQRQAALDYASKEIYPLVRQGIEPARQQREQLNSLTGGLEISSEPGPYLVLGIDMYAKATSPLRRFSDLLLHWQIHAALAFERVAKRRLDPEQDKVDDVVPFSAAKLADTLPMLQMREQKGRAMSRGVRDWILIALVRAWRFEGRAPAALRFTVTMTGRKVVFGRLDLLGIFATLDASGLDGCRLIKDVQLGDRFDVELVDVNVHSHLVLVRATRYLGQLQRGDGPGDRKPTQAGPRDSHAVHETRGDSPPAAGSFAEPIAA